MRPKHTANVVLWHRCLGCQRRCPATDPHARNPITRSSGALVPHYHLPRRRLTWTDDWNSTSPTTDSTAHVSSSGILADTRGCDYKHIFSRLTYPGLYSIHTKDKVEIGASGLDLGRRAIARPRSVNQVLMCPSAQNRGFISVYLSGRPGWSWDKISLFFSNLIAIYMPHRYSVKM